MDAFDHVTLSVSEGIAHIRLDHPPVNAVTQGMYAEIRRMFSGIAAIEPPIKVVVLSGNGRHFCAGNDLEEFQTLDSENSVERMLEVRRCFWAIYKCPVPVIAAVHGAALGTGLALAAVCDFIIAAEGSRIGLPEVAIGVMGGSKHLRRLVPEPIMRWMFFSGEPSGVERLVQLGAVLDVVPEAELLSAAMDRAVRIARHSAVALRIAKRTLNDVENMDLMHGYELEQERTGRLAAYADSVEARQAAWVRREPKYTDSPLDAQRAAESALS